MAEKLPNVLVCGTPGTGKTTLCRAVAEALPRMNHVDMSDLVKSDAKLHEGFDEATGAFVINDDAVVDALEPLMERGGVLLDAHSLIDYFPERWFDLVLVLQTDNTVLYDRLTRRGYAERKVRENVECEIMQVVADEARESYEPDIVQFLESNTTEQMEDNVERLVTWLTTNCASLRSSSSSSSSASASAR